jgi:hypothetical protein
VAKSIGITAFFYNATLHITDPFLRRMPLGKADDSKLPWIAACAGMTIEGL